MEQSTQTTSSDSTKSFPGHSDLPTTCPPLRPLQKSVHTVCCGDYVPEAFHTGHSARVSILLPKIGDGILTLLRKLPGWERLATTTGRKKNRAITISMACWLLHQGPRIEMDVEWERLAAVPLPFVMNEEAGPKGFSEKSLEDVKTFCRAAYPLTLSAVEPPEARCMLTLSNGDEYFEVWS